MKLKLASLGCLAVLAAATALPAYAAPLVFTLTGSRTATFQFDTNPTPSSFNSGAFSSQSSFNSVSGVFGGVVGTASINFGTGSAADLNISSANLGFTQFSGPVLFSGTSSAPVFTIGVYNLASIVSGSSVLTITQGAVSAAPEPGVWALMLGGTGLAGLALRRRKQLGGRSAI